MLHGQEPQPIRFKLLFPILSCLPGASHIETPLIFSEKFSKHLGADVFLKLDMLQPSGSFKLRGVGLTVQEAAKAGALCIVSSSGGNAGLAAAYAARNFNLPCTVGCCMLALKRVRWFCPALRPKVCSMP